NGNSSDGVRAGLTTCDTPPLTSVCSSQIHDASASTSVYDPIFAGTTHSLAPARAWRRYRSRENASFGRSSAEVVAISVAAPAERPATASAAIEPVPAAVPTATAAAYATGG